MPKRDGSLLPHVILFAGLCTPWLAGCSEAPTRNADAACPDAACADDAMGDAGAKPWIKVSDNRRYFVFEDGRPFFPIGDSIGGEQLGYDNYGTVKLSGKTITMDPTTVEKAFRDKRDRGENFLRIDIEGLGWESDAETTALIDAGKLQFLEDPVGQFNETYARQIDKVILLAEEYGIYLDLVLMPHSCQLTGIREKLPLHPYHTTHGGPLATMQDFFTLEEAKSAYKRRIEYIVDRWGNSPNIFIWEIHNELGFCGSSGETTTDAEWVAEIASHLQTYEMNKRGRRHLVAVSSPGFIPSEDVFATSPDTDVATIHYYSATTKCLPKPIDVAREIRRQLPGWIASRVQFQKPHLENERIAGAWPPNVGAEAEHAAAWTELTSGSAGSGAPWISFARTVENGPMSPRFGVMASTHGALRKILDGFDFGSFDSKPAGGVIEATNPSIIVSAVADNERVIGWLLHDNPGDHEIDAINEVRQMSSVDPWAARFKYQEALHRWTVRMKRDRVPLALEPFAIATVKAFVQYLGVTEAEGRSLAADLAREPCGFWERNKSHAEKNDDVEGLAVALFEIADDLRAYLETLEPTYTTLAEDYTGHPSVFTTLRASGLCDGEHRITWYDDQTGDAVATETFRGTTLDATSPVFSKHLAFIITSEVDCR